VVGGDRRTSRQVQGVACADPDARLSVHLDILHVRDAERDLLEDRRAGALELEEEQAGIAQPVAAVPGIDPFGAAAAREEEAEGRRVERDRLSERPAGGER